MRFEQLQCLVEVARKGSIRGAAENMYMTPQAISLAVRQLEQELGTELMIRTKNGIMLTDAGREALTMAEEILFHRERMKNRFDVMDKETDCFTYQINIGSTSSTINYVLPEVLKKLNHQKNRLNVRLENVEEMDDLLHKINLKEYDLGLVSINEAELRSKLKGREEDFDITTLVRDEMVVVTDRKLIKDGQSSISIAEVRQHPLTTCNIVVRESSRKSAREHSMAVSNDMAFHRGMIEKMGACVAMPGLSAQVFFNSKKYAVLEYANEKNEIIHCAVCRKEDSSRVRLFISLIQQELYTK